MILFLERKYDSENDKDAAILLELLDMVSSDIELSDEDEEMLDIPGPSSRKKSVRVGADRIGPYNTELPQSHWSENEEGMSMSSPSRKKENYTGDDQEWPTLPDESQSINQWDDEDILPLSVFAGPSSLQQRTFSKFVTTKEAIKWRKKDFEPPEFAENEQNEDLATTPIDEPHDPLYFFSKYINELQFQEMATFTNIYAFQKEEVQFKNTTADEIKSFFGLHIITGCLKFPEVRLYWQKNLHINIFNETMSRDIFFQLRSNLHCVNNLTIPNNCTDKFYKVRPLYDSIRKRCLDLKLEENLCIDEQIVPFRGHFSVVQYIKGKPTPWGVKIFVLCGKSGMAYDFVLYQGASTGLDALHLKEFGFGATIVLHLSERTKDTSCITIIIFHPTNFSRL